MIAHCLFEQSGTFKKEFEKLGIKAYDYDILNDFRETDYQIDLFNEIEKAYGGGKSIFDNIKQDDIILAFFPCTLFEVQQIMWFQGTNYAERNWTEEKKLEYNIKKHKELNDLYTLISKLTIIILRKKLKMIIENPYSTQHYLVRYWSIKSKVVDVNRQSDGDFYKKQTQYWFINCEPKHNYVNDKLEECEKKKIVYTYDRVERSMMHPQYARRFIKKYIIDYDNNKKDRPSEEKTLFDYLL